MPALVFFTLLLLALGGVAAAMLIALPRMEGWLMDELSPAPVDLPAVSVPPVTAKT